MAKEPKELYNGFVFLRTGDKVDSPLVAYTLNLESVNIDCLEEEFEEKIEALKNGKDVTIKLVCNKAEVVSHERIIEYACGKQKQPEIIRCKDCKHWKYQFKTANGDGLGSCDFHNVALVTSEGFCYWAEKRGEQE